MRAHVALSVVALAAVHAPSNVVARSPLTQSKEYVTSAKQQTVLKSNLMSVPGKEGTVLRIELAKEWVGDWHYHTGDVFVYVVSGQFAVEVEGQGRKQFGAGEVYHEAVNTAMRARNPSATRSTELILFQVGGQGEPLMLIAKPPQG